MSYTIAVERVVRQVGVVTIEAHSAAEAEIQAARLMGLKALAPVWTGDEPLTKAVVTHTAVAA